ncbi:hypothetical protein [Tsukamurella tyrosinosolvens]|uniref:hypothetical protein n=1 Tax=Tsukamurella tyrosinosolvens TaxID=57704 RepID=UPI002DD44BE0|nr:hypothetical protein [Tsukamurella tyrosinosolvens]MEC4615510.1 hypothetical protein [Tsukamurella tyrosinosolvens]
MAYPYDERTRAARLRRRERLLAIMRHPNTTREEGEAAHARFVAAFNCEPLPTDCGWLYRDRPPAGPAVNTVIGAEEVVA